MGRHLDGALDLVGDGARRAHERCPCQSAGWFFARLEAPYGRGIVREETGVREERPDGRLSEDRTEVGDVRRSMTARRDEHREEPWRRAPHPREIGRRSNQPLTQPYHGRHVGS